MAEPDINLAIYNQPDVVKHYADASGLQPCEAYIFEKYIRPGEAILDIGMGGGRTTPFLSAGASRYVGADYSQAMVDVCRAKFPALEFHRDDASDLSRFGDATFDVVVFSFNGIDYIRTDEARARCLREVHRVLRPGGRFIFSSHNASAIGVWPILRGATPAQIAWRIVRAIWRTAMLTVRQLPSGAFRAGKGYVVDPTHGGLATFCAIPERMIEEGRAADFDCMETVDGLYPISAGKYFAPWYYYALTKS